jgi:hypothetical protein
LIKATKIIGTGIVTTITHHLIIYGYEALFIKGFNLNNQTILLFKSKKELIKAQF